MNFTTDELKTIKECFTENSKELLEKMKSQKNQYELIELKMGKEIPLDEKELDFIEELIENQSDKRRRFFGRYSSNGGEEEIKTSIDFLKKSFDVLGKSKLIRNKINA